MNKWLKETSKLFHSECYQVCHTANVTWERMEFYLNICKYLNFWFMFLRGILYLICLPAKTDEGQLESMYELDSW